MYPFGLGYRKRTSDILSSFDSRNKTNKGLRQKTILTRTLSDLRNHTEVLVSPRQRMNIEAVKEHNER